MEKCSKKVEHIQKSKIFGIMELRLWEQNVRKLS